jgi:hypothetical protein
VRVLARATTTVGVVCPFYSDEGLNARVKLLPINFDGTLMLVPPRDPNE